MDQSRSSVNKSRLIANTALCKIWGPILCWHITAAIRDDLPALAHETGLYCVGSSCETLGLSTGRAVEIRGRNSRELGGGVWRKSGVPVQVLPTACVWTICLRLRSTPPPSEHGNSRTTAVQATTWCHFFLMALSVNFRFDQNRSRNTPDFPFLFFQLCSPTYSRRFQGRLVPVICGRFHFQQLVFDFVDLSLFIMFFDRFRVVLQFFGSHFLTVFCNSFFMFNSSCSFYWVVCSLLFDVLPKENRS